MAELWPFAALAGAALVGMAAIMGAAWLAQLLCRNSGWVDVFWSFGTGAVCAAAALWPLPGDASVLPARRILVAAFAFLWALRLGSYIAFRVTASSEDPRYVALRRLWGSAYQERLFWFLMVQALVGAALAVCVGVGARAPGLALGPRDGLAAVVWLAAIAGESLADDQMRRFRADPENRDRICERGLWAWSRHPNYFFEWLGWLAYPLLAVRPDDAASLLTLLAPLLMFLVLRYGSGVPPLERSMLERRGEAFRVYQARTSAFFPLPPRRA